MNISYSYKEKTISKTSQKSQNMKYDSFNEHIYEYNEYTYLQSSFINCKFVQCFLKANSAIIIINTELKASAHMPFLHIYWWNEKRKNHKRTTMVGLKIKQV